MCLVCSNTPEICSVRLIDTHTLYALLPVGRRALSAQHTMSVVLSTHARTRARNIVAYETRTMPRMDFVFQLYVTPCATNELQRPASAYNKRACTSKASPLGTLNLRRCSLVYSLYTILYNRHYTFINVTNRTTRNSPPFSAAVPRTETRTPLASGVQLAQLSSRHTYCARPRASAYSLEPPPQSTRPRGVAAAEKQHWVNLGACQRVLCVCVQSSAQRQRAACISRG